MIFALEFHVVSLSPLSTARRLVNGLLDDEKKITLAKLLKLPMEIPLPPYPVATPDQFQANYLSGQYR